MLHDYTRAANSLSVSLGFLLFCLSECTYTQMNDRDRITGIPLSWLDLLLFFFGSHSQVSVLNWGLLIVHKLSQPCDITGEELYWASGSSPRLEQQFPNLKDALKVSFKKGFMASLKSATSPS